MFQFTDKIPASRADMNGFISIAGIFTYLQDCSSLWIESEPDFKKYLHANGIGTFIVSRQVDILNLPRCGEDITVRTGVFENKSSLGFRNTNIYDALESPCALSWSIIAFVDIANGRLVRLPKDVMDKIKYDKKSDMDYLDRKIQISERAIGVDYPPFKVTSSDIDIYNHMNNARYIEIAVNGIPAHEKIKRIRVEYKNQTLLGESIYTRVFQRDSVTLVVIQDEEKKVKAIVEITQ